MTAQRLRLPFDLVPTLCLVLMITAGCGGEGPQLYSMSGSVTYDGRPVPYGDVFFEPDVSRGNRGPGVRAPIRDGAYSTPDKKGIVGGPYVVRIHGSDGVALETPHEGLDKAGTPLFDEYSERVEFPHDDAVHDFAVPAESRE